MTPSPIPRFARGPRCFLGVDPGTRRIGLAVATEGGLGGRGLRTLDRSRRLGHDLELIVRASRDAGACAIVVGLPCNADGSEGPAARSAREFAAALRKVADLPVLLHDEFGTTREAEADLLLAGVPISKHRAMVDQWAAIHLLEAFLAAGAPGAPSETVE